MAMVGGTDAISRRAIVGAAIVTLLKNSLQDYLPRDRTGASGQLEHRRSRVLFILLLQQARGGIVPLRCCASCRARSPPPPAARSGLAEPRQQPDRGQPLLSVDGADAPLRRRWSPSTM